MSENAGTTGERRKARAIADDEAAQEIVTYLDSHSDETVYPDDLAEALGLDLMRVIELCEMLSAEGKIGRSNV